MLNLVILYYALVVFAAAWFASIFAMSPYVRSHSGGPIWGGGMLILVFTVPAAAYHVSWEDAGGDALKYSFYCVFGGLVGGYLISRLLTPLTRPHSNKHE